LRAAIALTPPVGSRIGSLVGDRSGFPAGLIRPMDHHGRSCRQATALAKQNDDPSFIHSKAQGDAEGKSGALLVACALG